MRTERVISAGQVHEKIERVCRANMDAETFQYEVIRVLRRAVPFDAWCWPLFDPETLLPCAAMAESPFQIREQLRIFTLNYQLEEPAWVLTLSRSRELLSRLSARTEGDFARNHLWEEVYRSNGLGDEILVVLKTGGVCWGALLLYRAYSARCFTPEEEELIRRLIYPLSTRLRQILISPSPATILPSIGPGVVILDPDLLPVTITPLAQHWLAQIWPSWPGDTQAFPSPIAALIARLEAIENKRIPDCWAPRVRVRSLAGSWFVIQVERFASSPLPGAIALTIQPALPSQMLPLLLQGFALTRREQELTHFVLQGLSTAEIAVTLHISPHTVQEHLKAIFTKVGVGSRRELVARLHMSFGKP
jgi:DNA-binding CsgD family transcriptional regulator